MNFEWNDKCLITGSHSIAEALKNPLRYDKEIWATQEGLKEFKKKYRFDEKVDFAVKIVNPHDLQSQAESYFKQHQLNFNRVSSGLFLKCTSLKTYDINWLKERISEGKLKKILVLDQVSDVHNVGAILRTASFYAVDAIVTSTKNNLTLNPNLSKIASGGLEYVPLVNCSSLSKAATLLQELNVTCCALTEHASTGIDEISSEQLQAKAVALFLGAEEKGLSHAVLRLISLKVSLVAAGNTHSLNVSVAAALAMQKIFGRSS